MLFRSLRSGELHFPLPGSSEREKHSALDYIWIEQPAQVVWLATWGEQALVVRHVASLREPPRLLPRTLPALHFLAYPLRGGAGLLAAGRGVCVMLSLDNWHVRNPIFKKGGGGPPQAQMKTRRPRPRRTYPACIFCHYTRFCFLSMPSTQPLAIRGTDALTPATGETESASQSQPTIG